MYKRTQLRRILEYLRDELSVREIARILHVSRNTIYRIQLTVKNLNSTIVNYLGIFVGQYPVDTWHERLGGGTLADSIMDRMIHNSYPFHSNDNNLRKVYDEQRLKQLLDSFES